MPIFGMLLPFQMNGMMNRKDTGIEKSGLFKSLVKFRPKLCKKI